MQLDMRLGAFRKNICGTRKVNARNLAMAYSYKRSQNPIGDRADIN